MKQTTKITVGIIVIISCFFLYFLSGSESLGEDEKIELKEAKINEQKRKQQKQLNNTNFADFMSLSENQGLIGTVIIFGIIISVVMMAFMTRGRF